YRVLRGLAVQHQRFADDIQVGVGANAGELRRAVAFRIGTEGLVIVPVERRLRHAVSSSSCVDACNQSLSAVASVSAMALRCLDRRATWSGSPNTFGSASCVSMPASS